MIEEYRVLGKGNIAEIVSSSFREFSELELNKRKVKLKYLKK